MDYRVFDWTQLGEVDFSRYGSFKAKGSEWLDAPIAFDIETTSFFTEKSTGLAVSMAEYEKRILKDAKYENEVEKTSLCYVWQFAVRNTIFTGRTLGQFAQFMRALERKLRPLKIIVYVHNLAYEFQFIRKYFEWQEVFATDNRKVLFARTGFATFKCSYFLSAKSLARLAGDVHTVKVEKMEGDLDYSKLRTSETPLTEAEWKYCYYDVLIVTAYIAEQSAMYGGLAKIPLTNTGRVRRYTRKECFRNKAYATILHKSLVLTPLEFEMARFAFQGGYTHANAVYTNLVCLDVSSYDFTSSYPTVMIAEQYPMGRGARQDNLPLEEFEGCIQKYCAIFVLELWGVETVKDLQPIISRSKCLKIEKPRVDNGRVFSADYLMTVITEVDYRNIKAFYTWKNAKVGVAFFYQKGYLPKEILNCVLKFYADKTTLKGVEGKELEYLISKEMLNSLYGMCVYNPIKKEYVYENGEWGAREKEVNEKTVGEYNRDKTRFTFYLWGVYITAYARANLFTAIRELKNDFIYADTDSVKIFHRYRHKNYFKKYNNALYQKLKKTCLRYGYSEGALKPRNARGREKLLGIWDYEGDYERFKTLGAKRYMVEKNGKLDLTVSGVNKKLAMPYLEKKYGHRGAFDAFNGSLYIPKEYTGKRVRTYIDTVQSGIATDYLGNTCAYSTQSGVHLMECEYDLSITADYLRFFRYMQNSFDYV